MCTTLTLDDDLANALSRTARLSGRSFKGVVNEAIRLGLACGESGRPAWMALNHWRSHGLWLSVLRG